ncbi:MAG TPA: hypothetical protein PLZ86_04960 [bacterium]|nr:hypothetical protein [bacterium]
MSDKTVTATALYSCTTKMPYTEKHTVEKEVSVEVKEGEGAKETYEKLKKAAAELNGKYVDGCAERSFIRFKDMP